MEENEEESKRAKSRHGTQGVKRKAGEEESEEEDIRRLIEEEVVRVNAPGMVRGEPSKLRHVGGWK